VIAEIISFFQNPANALVHYAMSAILILAGIILHGVRIKVINKATPYKPPSINRTLSRLVNLSTISGLILAALTFYLTFY
jgi:uncharacterized membrane-anchored protein